MVIDDVGEKTKYDIGGGLAGTQIDVYIGQGGDAIKAQADAWGKPNKWVIKLE